MKWFESTFRNSRWVMRWFESNFRKQLLSRELIRLNFQNFQFDSNKKVESNTSLSCWFIFFARRIFTTEIRNFVKLFLNIFPPFLKKNVKNVWMWHLVRQLWPRYRGHVTTKIALSCVCFTSNAPLVSNNWLLCDIRLPTVILSVLTRHCQVTYIFKVIWGRPGSPAITNELFLLITCDWKETRSWEWSHYICLVKTLRSMCNMN